MNTDLPKEAVNVMLTYETIIGRGVYGEHKTKEVVTRRAIYFKSNGFYDCKDNWIETPNGYFAVPQYWQNFTFSDGTIALLPHTFYSYGRVFPDKIIKWEYDK